MFLLVSRGRLSHNISGFFIPRRFRYKKKWAIHSKEKSSTDHALEYFDVYHKPLYGKFWPSIRISLLSQQKYGALVNNFSLNENIVSRLKRLSAFDIIQQAKDTKPLVNENVIPTKSEITKEQETFKFDPEENEEPEPENLHTFMPVMKVYSEKQLLREEEEKQCIYVPKDIVKTVPCSSTSLPENLKLYTYDLGNVNSFPRPSLAKTGLLDYYLLDAASILPVVALNLVPNDYVLDLCAAPGGKSLTILQTLLTENLVSNDISRSRMQRLVSVLKYYTNRNKENSSIKVTCKDGLEFTEPIFDKVLVDVPCNSDRHVLLDEENNLFKPGRIEERIRIPKLQSDLLVAGIKSCKPGGSVVYSTCTLSFSQNDGAIQSAFETIWKETNIDIVVEDIQPLLSHFRNTFVFYPKCRFGQLVLPKLTSNFGPMYICKINRLK